MYSSVLVSSRIKPFFGIEILTDNAQYNFFQIQRGSEKNCIDPWKVKFAYPGKWGNQGLEADQVSQKMKWNTSWKNNIFCSNFKVSICNLVIMWEVFMFHRRKINAQVNQSTS